MTHRKLIVTALLMLILLGFGHSAANEPDEALWRDLVTVLLNRPADPRHPIIHKPIRIPVLVPVAPLD